MNTQIIRCPVCLASQPVKDGLAADTQLYCGNCKRSFLARNALPLNENDPVHIASRYGANAGPQTISMANKLSMQVVTTRNLAVTWIAALAIWLFTFSKARPYMATLKGPEFLWFYFLMFSAVWLGLFAVRKFWEDSTQITVVAVLFFESIGAVRFFDASAAGMHKFGYLILMMVIGAVVYSARTDHSSGSSWSSQSSSCGSSCSGCGGGGGCGGCGG